MDSSELSDAPLKTKRLNNSDKVATKSSQPSTAASSSNSSAMRPSSSSKFDFFDVFSSSFNYSNHIPATSSDLLVLDITKYIPMGCLRIHFESIEIGRADWKSCSIWQAFPHQKDLENKRGGRYLNKDLQSAFFSSPILKPYIGIHAAGWIRMEFKSNDAFHGQIRVYVLPDDIGRGHINRNDRKLRKAHKLLLSNLDLFRDTWEGDWNINSPFFHVDPIKDSRSDKDLSLFEVFDSLPSPEPTPEIVTDADVRRAIHCILDSDIPGLVTPLYKYQCRSAALMLQREYYPGQIMDPRLTPEFDLKGNKWFCDLNSGRCFRDTKTFEGVRGGICAETMGLGKTLICLALILASKDFSSQIPVEYFVDTFPVRKSTGSLLDMCASYIGRNGLLWKEELQQIEDVEGYKFEHCREAIERGAGNYCFVPESHLRGPRRKSSSANTPESRKVWLCTTTLVVVPSNLVKQWQSEIRKHTTGLNVLTFTSSDDKIPSARELAKYDIILFSKGRFDLEGKFSLREPYHSPLTDLHFKRLIVDEGHNFGNSGSSFKTKAAAVIESLQLSTRWIVSGTPTPGLGTLRSNGDISKEASLDDDDDAISEESSLGPKSDDTTSMMFIKQERCDLEKLGNIATSFLKARPWALPTSDRDYANWKQIVMQPRHGSKSRGNMQTLRFALEGMIIKHRPEDIDADVTLPLLHQNFIYLDGSVQDKISLNVFSLLIIVNAATSERKDADYFFHSRQRKHLSTLVSNLRQASFFWSGTTREMIRGSIENARKFLEERKVPISTEDETLLMRAIEVGESILANSIWKAVSEWHELPILLHNQFHEDTRSWLSLIGEPSDPTVAGTTMLLSVQKHVNSQLWKQDPRDDLFETVQQGMESAWFALQKAPGVKELSGSKSLELGKKAHQTPSALNATINGGSNPNPRKRGAPPSNTRMEGNTGNLYSLSTSANPFRPNEQPTLKSALKKSTKLDETPSIDPESSLASTQVVSSASAKLSYLMDKISLHHKTEKILVFYESDNVAYYIAQALELMGIQHLIYAKSLSTARRSQYVVTFNQTETFRVLLMDVSQAAFGLNMSSASRVFFVNPVFSPQIEAQAVKRAHRIGQTKQVYVETLVLKDSVEEVMIKRRELMSNEEHMACKNILDDEIIYNWIRNAQFIPTPFNGIEVADQMAKLDTPQLLFGRDSDKSEDPDADLILNDTESTSDNRRGSLFSRTPRAVRRTAKVKSDSRAPAPEPAFEPVDVPTREERPAEERAGALDDDWEVPPWDDSEEEPDF